MKCYRLILIFLIGSVCSLSAQYVEIDRISWGDYADGARTGTSAGGATWLADPDDSGNQDGTGFFGSRAGRFVWDDWEGSLGCPCTPGDPGLNCGNNNNSIFANISASFPYCEVKISFNVLANGSLECGSNNDKNPNDGYAPGICPTDLGNDWAGTDFMSIRFVDNGTGAEELINICGNKGAGLIERTFSINSGFNIISIFITAGTQEAGEIYEITDIVVEGLRSVLNTPMLSARMVTGQNNTICENGGRPIKLITLANSNYSFSWAGPNGFTSTDPQPEIATFTTAASGVYSVTVTDANGCQLMDDVNITVLPGTDNICTMPPIFIYDQSPQNSVLCSNTELPDTSDNGILGIWTPGADLSSFAGQTTLFTFTPNDGNIPIYTVTLQVDDITKLDSLGINPPSVPIFCNSDNNAVDLINIFGLDTSLLLRVNGANQLFDFVPPNDFLNNYINQFTNFNFLGVTAGSYTFFIEAVTPCGETAIDAFTFKIIGPADPIRIDTSICVGDTLNFENYRFFSDSVIYFGGGGACDTSIVVNLNFNQPGRMRNGSFYPGGFISLSCAALTWVYLYDSIGINGTRGVLISDDANDPANPNYVDVFKQNYIGPYTLPFITARNGCDSIVNLRIEFSNQGNIIRDTFDLCSNLDTFYVIEGTTHRISAANPILYIAPLLSGSCNAAEIVANIIQVVEDTISMPMYCADEFFELSGERFDRDRPTGRVFFAQGANGCSSSTLVDLKFIEPVEQIVNRRICPGQVVQVGNQFFNTNMTDSLILLPRMAASGCDSTVRLSISVLRSTPPIIVSELICPRTSYTFMGEVFDENRRSGVIRVPSMALPCDSLEFRVQIGFYEDEYFMSDTICSGDSFDLGGALLDSTSNYRAALINPITGCDSIVNLSLFVRPANTFRFSDSLCSGLSYPFGNQTIISTGTYSEVFTSQVTGCDSTVTLDYVALPVPFDTIRRVICQGEVIVHGTNTITTAGLYDALFVTVDGCDSTAVLEVMVNDTFLTEIFDTILLGESVTYGGQTFMDENIYDIPLTAQTGCDSTLRLNLEVIEQIFVDVDTTLCFSEVLTVGSNSYNTSTVETITLTGSTGFDSIINLTLTVLSENRVTISDEICEGDSILFNGLFLKTSGRETGIFSSTVNRCDSIVDFDLTVHPRFDESFSEAICAGESYDFDNRILTTPGIYTANFQSVNGCDSMVTLDLMVNDTFNIQFVDTIVRGETLDLLGQILSEPGTYSVTLNSQSGCDSTLSLSLTVLEEVNVVLDTTICPGANVFLFNNSYSTNTMEVFRRPGGPGAPDTIVDLTVRVVDLNTLLTTITQSICFNETYFFAGIDRNTTGLYRDTLIGFIGCDSIVTLDLTVYPNPTVGPIDRTICVGSSIMVGNNTYDTDGTYIDTLTSVNGCDSVVILDLKVRSEFVINLNPVLCPGETFIVGTDTYSVSGTSSDTLLSIIGCDSIVNVDLTILEENIVDLTETLCAGEFLSIGGVIYDQTTTTSVVIPSSQNCDSTINLNLTILNEINTVIIESVCFGETYTVGTETYSTTDIHITRLQASNGCDSTVRLDLTVFPEAINNLDAVICDGDIITVGSQEFSIPGTYTIDLVNGNGCDSTVNLALSVVEQFETPVAASICIGENYSFGGQQLTESGSYVDTLSSSIGCDSIVTLTLAVIPEFSLNIGVITGTCDGLANGSFVINSINGSTAPIIIDGLPSGVQTISSVPSTISNLPAGSYNMILTDANGCMSSQSVTITNDRNSLLTIVAIRTGADGGYDLGLQFDGLVSSILWDNVSGLSCFDCPNPSITVIDVTTVGVTVVDADGCVYTASIILDVNNIGNIYIPSIFSPEGSVVNSRFYLQGENGEQAFYDLDVYDRWGNLVYEVKNAVLNDPSFGWNGRYGDSSLNSGVFVYKAVVYDTQSNGSETYEGSITLIK